MNTKAVKGELTNISPIPSHIPTSIQGAIAQDASTGIGDALDWADNPPEGYEDSLPDQWLHDGSPILSKTMFHIWEDPNHPLYSQVKDKVNSLKPQDIVICIESAPNDFGKGGATCYKDDIEKFADQINQYLPLMDIRYGFTDEANTSAADANTLYIVFTASKSLFKELPSNVIPVIIEDPHEWQNVPMDKMKEAIYIALVGVTKVTPQVLREIRLSLYPQYPISLEGALWREINGALPSMGWTGEKHYDQFMQLDPAEQKRISKEVESIQGGEKTVDRVMGIVRHLGIRDTLDADEQVLLADSIKKLEIIAYHMYKGLKEDPAKNGLRGWFAYAHLKFPKKIMDQNPKLKHWIDFATMMWINKSNPKQ